MRARSKGCGSRSWTARARSRAASGGLEVALGGQDQPFAAAGAGLAPGALDPAEAVLQIGQEPARLLELAQLDERLDRVRQLSVDARLAPPRRGEARCQRPQDPVGSRRIADRELEEAEHAEVLEPEDLVSAALRERDPALGGVTGLLDAPEMRVDERACVEEGAHVLLAADLLGALVPLRRIPRGERPVAGAELELRLVKEGSRHRALRLRARPPDRAACPSGRAPRRAVRRTSAACPARSSDCWCRTPRSAQPPPRGRPLARAIRASARRRTASRTRRPSRAQSREWCDRPRAPPAPTPPARARAPGRRRPERAGSHRCSTRSSRRGRRRPSVVESALRELEAPLEALLRAREQQQRVRSRATGG